MSTQTLDNKKWCWITTGIEGHKTSLQGSLMHGEPLNISEVDPQQLGKDTTQKC